jgi:hypothetical protein
MRSGCSIKITPMERNQLAQPGTSEYSADGIDLTLIRWMLSLTPDERLQVLQQFVNSVEDIRARNAVTTNHVLWIH